QERAAVLADGRVAGDGRSLVHAGAIARGRADGRVTNRTRGRQARPGSVLAAELGPVLTARGARGIRDPAERARLPGRSLLLRHAVGTRRLPVAVPATELCPRLARHRAVRVDRPLVEAVIVRRLRRSRTGERPDEGRPPAAASGYAEWSS